MFCGFENLRLEDLDKKKVKLKLQNITQLLGLHSGYGYKIYIMRVTQLLGLQNQ